MIFIALCHSGPVTDTQAAGSSGVVEKGEKIFNSEYFPTFLSPARHMFEQ
jgi:hypothetical protein